MVKKSKQAIEAIPELSGMVSIISTGVYMPDGKEYTVNAILATTLINKGLAKLKT